MIKHARAALLTATGLLLYVSFSFDVTHEDDEKCMWGEGVWCSNTTNCAMSSVCSGLPESIKASPNWAFQKRLWFDIQSRMKKAAEGRRGSLELLMIGDSITEALMGTSIGRWHASYYCKPFPRAFVDYFGKGAHASGIGGDRTEQLIWRLLHGELQGLDPENVVTLIGTNNVGTGQSARDTADGVIAVSKLLGNMYKSKNIIILAILPRADCSGLRNCTPGRLPNTKNNVVEEANTYLESWFSQQHAVRWLDCNKYLYNRSLGILDKGLFPDGLHPALSGYRRIWKNCLSPVLKKRLAK
eukprot:TRINITY_DN8655_c0_g1_i1.p1 TRINITY_DN8655_c0_g1~~TRINITY_DN8655_c0_g1_i1.p1  ORF type:complete len:300 (+),score=49.45 TRINITY_DN8655_c0_g1_i1:32-931(+)